MENINIPIKFKDSYEGLAESSGLLSLKEDNLVIQYETKDSILGVIKSGLKTLQIPLKHIEELTYKKSILGNKITFKVDDLSYIADVPCRDNNEVILKVERKHIEQAIDLIRAIRLDMSEKEYQDAIQSA